MTTARRTWCYFSTALQSTPRRQPCPSPLLSFWWHFTPSTDVTSFCQAWGAGGGVSHWWVQPQHVSAAEPSGCSEPAPVPLTLATQAHSSSQKSWGRPSAHSAPHLAAGSNPEPFGVPLHKAQQPGPYARAVTCWDMEGQRLHGASCPLQLPPKFRAGGNPAAEAA